MYSLHSICIRHLKAFVWYRIPNSVFLRIRCFFLKKTGGKEGKTASRAIVTSNTTKNALRTVFKEAAPQRAALFAPVPFTSQLSRDLSLHITAMNTFLSAEPHTPGPPQGPSLRPAPLPGRAPGRAPARGAHQCPRPPSLPRPGPAPLPQGAPGPGHSGGRRQRRPNVQTGPAPGGPGPARFRFRGDRGRPGQGGLRRGMEPPEHSPQGWEGVGLGSCSSSGTGNALGIEEYEDGAAGTTLGSSLWWPGAGTRAAAGALPGEV